MAFDAFLKIEGITDKLPDQELRLESFSWGVSNSGTISPTGGAGGFGKASFQDFSFAAQAGEQSPLLFESAATGEHAKTASLRVTDKFQPLMITFTDVLISSYKIDEGSLFSQKCLEGGVPAVQLGAPMESVSFNFLKFEFQVGGTSATGGNNGSLP
jgi:type VI protein secretion system component Hcp